MAAESLRAFVFLITHADSKSYSLLQSHAQKVFEQLGVSVYIGNDELKRFPKRREDFLLLLEWLECSFESKGVSTNSLGDIMHTLAIQREERDVAATCGLLALLLPSALFLAATPASSNMPSVQFSANCPSPLRLVGEPSCKLSLDALPSRVSLETWSRDATMVLRSIHTQTVSAVPAALCKSASSTSSWWDTITWTDLCDALSSLEKPAANETIEFSTLSGDEKDFALMQLGMFSPVPPEIYQACAVRLPRTEQGKQLQAEALRTLHRFRPWAGPYTQEHLSRSLWQNSMSKEIVTYDAMMRLAWGDVPLLLGGSHFRNVQLQANARTEPLSGGQLSAGSTDDVIVNALVGDAASLPKTFSVVPEQRMFTDWDQGTTLRSISVSNSRLSDIQVKGILFQITWTLAVLQKEYEGFQHNNLSSSIRLVRFGKTRCYKVVGTGGGFTFCIPSSVPLPVITNFATANCLLAESGVPRRKNDSFDAGSDLRDVLQILTQNTLGVEAFAPAFELQKSCDAFCNPSRLVFESAVDKSAPIPGTTFAMQSMLLNDVFDVFLSKAGPSSSAVAQVDTF